MTTVAFVEIEDFPRKVLNKHWPGIPIARDIKNLKYENGILYENGIPIYAGPIDVVCGGFPCQPFSQAGLKGGTADDRDLWPEMFRIIQEVRPRWVIGENVAGFLAMGLKRTFTDLESEAYQVQAFTIPACAVGAPHRRERVWIIAHSIGERCGEAWPSVGGSKERVDGGSDESTNLADARSDAPRPAFRPGIGRVTDKEQNDRNKIRDDIGNKGHTYFKEMEQLNRPGDHEFEIKGRSVSMLNQKKFRLK